MATFKTATPPWRAAVSGNGGVRQQEFPEAASQTFKKFDLVNLVNGKVTVLSSTPTTDLILGMAMADASGTTDTKIPVLIADDNVEFQFPIGADSAGNAVTVVTDIGKSGGNGVEKFTISSRSAWAYDYDNTTNHVLEAVEIALTYPVGATYGTYWCKVLPAFRQLG